MQAKRSLRRVSLILPIALAALLFASPTGALAAYVSGAVTPNYVQANAPLEVSPGVPFSGDDEFLQIPLPFPFTFYGQTFTSAWVSTNGFITFNDINQEPITDPWLNHCPFPVATATVATPPNGAIYGFWDDLDVDGLASMWHGTSPPPNQQYVIEWRNVRFINQLAFRRLDFQIVLHENGAITLKYQGPIEDSFEKGGEATIALERPDGRHADPAFPDDPNTLQQNESCNYPNLPNLGTGEFFAIRFDPVTESPEPPPTNIQNVAVDIKPKHAHNRFNVASRGKLSVAVLGTGGLDVTKIDRKTLKLAGVAPLYSWVENVRPQESHGWNRIFLRSGRRDRRLDLILKFDSQAIADALGSVNNGDVRELELRGKLVDGTEISGTDKVTIIQPKRKGMGSSHHDYRHSKSRHDDDDDDDD